jgi:hypothetical protein
MILAYLSGGIGPAGGDNSARLLIATDLQRA